MVSAAMLERRKVERAGRGRARGRDIGRERPGAMRTQPTERFPTGQGQSVGQDEEGWWAMSFAERWERTLLYGAPG